MEENRLRHELKLRKDWMDKMPFCPDHRDKVKGLSCRQCEVERLNMLIKAAYHLLMAAEGPKGGPTDWNETRKLWIERAGINEKTS